MILTRILWPQLSLTGGLLKTLYNTPCMLLVSCKRTVAEQLGIPEPPKGPKRPFWSFMMSHKQDIQTRFPKLSYPEILMKLGHMWSELSFDEKNKWVLEYERQKMAYQVRYRNYLETVGPEHIECMKYLKKQHQLKKKVYSQLVSRKKKKNCSVEKPKSPGNAFTMYLRTLDQGNTKLRDFMFAASTKWNTLPDKEKNMYHKQAKVLEDQYQSELSKWEKNMRLIGREDLIHNHQQWVQLKASTTPNNGSTEVQVKPTAPKPAKAAVSSDTNKRFRRIVIIKRT
ncbi:transcription factor A, mitochondrial-like [Homarus americanus]|uniref:transcription factor A, mitochondrial-like n=1 Tax=Homarus americanus TaxID=6706 RepID=UPI001C44005D|nr:transcription factor A, mitochondrial-like [Homarus americanus]